jgi:crotonobetainyl-CoA:carnitine CoA-transferase CaiB-like acyl-CoA transferase
VAAPCAAALRVVDLSTLWAGPLCGSIFAAMGASVLKVESRRRPDVGRQSAPRLFERLNGRKAQVLIDFDDPAELRMLTAQIAAADVLITSARPRAFEHWRLSPSVLFALNPHLIWVAITAYGWMGASALRIGFGDDAAAAGGLLDWTAAGEPRFMGDALADPLTGLEAARAALHAVAAGGGVLLDVALARTAATAAAAI